MAVKLSPAEQAAKDALNSVAIKNLKKDQAQALSLEKQRRTALETPYNQEYARNLANLGWITDQADPGNVALSGGWDLTGTGRVQTKSGQGLRGLTAGFTGRGSTRSSEFARARNQALQGYVDQLANTVGQRADWLKTNRDTTGFEASQRDAYNNAFQNAYQNALNNILNANKRSAGIL